MTTETTIKLFAKQFGVSIKLAREAFKAANGDYTKAFEYVLAIVKGQQSQSAK